MIETKEDLLRVMREHGACDGATRWVHSQTGTAGDIWASCKRVDWLLWLAVRLRPVSARQFSCWCADRLVRTYAADALDRAGIAHDLRSLAPIVDAQTADDADAAANAAYSAAHAAHAAHAAYAADAAAYAAGHAAYAAGHAANAAYAAADAAADAAAYAVNAAYAADAAAYAADAAANAAANADDERARQLMALHRLWPRLANKR